MTKISDLIIRKFVLILAFISLVAVAIGSDSLLKVSAEPNNLGDSEPVMSGVIADIDNAKGTLIVIGDYVFQPSSPTYNLRNYIIAMQTVYFDEEEEPEIYVRLGGHWYNQVTAVTFGVSERLDPSSLNEDGRFKYWNMESVQDIMQDAVKDATVQAIGEINVSGDFYSVILEDLLPTDAQQILWQRTDGSMVEVPHSGTNRLYLNQTEEPNGTVNVYYLVDGNWSKVTAVYDDTGHLLRVNSSWLSDAEKDMYLAEWAFGRLAVEDNAISDTSWNYLTTAVHYYMVAKANEDINSERLALLTAQYEAIISIDMSDTGFTSLEVDMNLPETASGVFVVFTGLTSLDLSNTGITDIGGVFELKTLETLNLSGNAALSIEPAVLLAEEEGSALESINIEGTDYEYSQYTRLIDAIGYGNVTVEQASQELYAIEVLNAASTEAEMEEALRAELMGIDFSAYDAMIEIRQENVLEYMLAQGPFGSIAEARAHFEAEVAWQSAIDEFRLSAVAKEIDVQSFYDALIAMGDFQGADTQNDELFLEVKALLEEYLGLKEIEEAFVEGYIYENAVSLWSREAILYAMQEGIEELRIAQAGVDCLELNREDNTILGPTEYNKAIEDLPNYWLLDVYLHSSKVLPEGTTLSLYFTGSDTPYKVITVGEEGLSEGYLSELFGFPGRNTLRTRYHDDGQKELRLEIVLPKDVTLEDLDFTVTIQTSPDNFDALIFDLAEATLSDETFMGVLATVNAASTEAEMWDALVALAQASDLSLDRDFTNTGDQSFIDEMNLSVANFVLNNVSYKTGGIFASIDDIQKAVDDAHVWFGEIRTFVHSSIHGTLTRSSFEDMLMALNTMAAAQGVNTDEDIEYLGLKVLLENSMAFIDTHTDNISLLNAAMASALEDNPNKYSRDVVLAQLTHVLEELSENALAKNVDDAVDFDYGDYEYKYNNLDLDEETLSILLDYNESVLRAYSMLIDGTLDDLYLGVMHDLTRYIGAFNRIDDSVIVAIEYSGTVYTWDDSLDHKGSNWADNAGTTLISVITSDFLADPSLTSIELTLYDAQGYNITIDLSFEVMFDIIDDFDVNVDKTNVQAGETFDVTIGNIINKLGGDIAEGTYEVVIVSDEAGIIFSDVLTSSDASLNAITLALTQATTHNLEITITQKVSGIAVGQESYHVTMNVEPNDLEYLFISPNQSQTVTAGVSLDFFVVRGEDLFGNIVDISSETVNWHGTDSQGIFYETIVGEYTVYASIGSVNSSTVTVTVEAAEVSYFELTGPTEITAGETATFTITVYDVFGNVATVANDRNFNLSTNKSPATLQSPRTIPAGSSSIEFTYRSSLMDTHTIFALSSGLTTQTLDIIVNPAELDNLTIEASATEITAGESVTFTITGKDQYGNPINLDELSIDWTEAVDGVLDTTDAGSYDVTATIGSVTSNEITVTINPAALDELTIEASETEITAGESVTFTITGEDQYGNAIILDTSSIDWTSPVENGVLDTTVAGSYDVTASIGSVTSNEITVTINADEADYFLVSGPMYILTDEMSELFTVTIYDQYGNVATVSEETILLLSSSDEEERIFDPSILTIAAGESSASFNYQSGSLGEQVLTVSFGMGDSNLSDVEATTSIVLVEEFYTVTAEYTGTSSTNMTADNNATLVGLDENDFTVTSIRRGWNPLHVGLNSDGTMRLYYSADDVKNTLEISIDSEYTIIEVTINFASEAGDTLIDFGSDSYVLSEHGNSSVTYSDLNTNSFSISNIHETNVQVHIESIEIIYVKNHD